jgi:hypothetical protein
MNHYIGIDIAKASLQVYIPEGDLDVEFDNTLQGLKKLHAKLKKIYGKSASEIIWIYESPHQWIEIQGGIRRSLMSRFPYVIYFRIVNKNTLRITIIKHQRRHPQLGLDRK